MRRDTRRKAGVRTAGVLFLVVMGVLVALSIKIYDKDFVTTVPVTLKASRIGNQLSPGGQVKARGVLVGEIRGVRATPQGAEIALALEPGKVDMLPRNVSALLVPKTLFGERYVQLSIPDGDRGPHLVAGDVIEQDHSTNAVELERVFDNLLPVLQAVQPQKLATTLTAVSTALEGRGEQLGKTIGTAADYLKEFNPDLPQLTSDVRDLATVSRLYGDIAPDLLDALTDSAVTLNTVNEKQADLGGVYQQVTSSSQEVAAFLANNRDNLISLAADSRAPLEIAAKYSPELRLHDRLAQRTEEIHGQGARRGHERTGYPRRRRGDHRQRQVPAGAGRPALHRQRRAALLPLRRRAHRRHRGGGPRHRRAPAGPAARATSASRTRRRSSSCWPRWSRRRSGCRRARSRTGAACSSARSTAARR